MLVWQITSLIALAAAAALFSRTPRANSTTSKVFFVSFLALTQVHILFLGQIGITFGVLPLAAGYLLWQKERHFLCGIMWSVLAIKLQTFLPVCLVAVAQLVAALAFKNRSGGRSRLQAATLMAAGLAAGVVLFQGSAILLFGLSSLDGWLQALSLVMKTLADPSQGWALQLIASLPGLITVASPGEWRQQMVAIAWLVSLSSLVLVFAALVKIAGAASDDDSRAKDLLLVVAYLSLPLVAHYLRIYDYSICLVPAWIGIFRGQRQSAVDQALFRAPVMLFFALDVYLIVLSVFGKDAASVLQLPLVITLIECWRQVTWPAYLLAARSPEPQSQAPLQ